MGTEGFGLGSLNEARADRGRRPRDIKEDWREGRFAPVPEEREFIPLPESGPVVVRYP